jgi:hypothetical protein
VAANFRRKMVEERAAAVNPLMLPH